MGSRLLAVAAVNTSRHNLAVLAQEQADYKRARALLEESLGIDRELGNKKGVAISLRNYGELMQLLGEFARAHGLYQQSLMLFHELDDKLGITACVEGFAVLATLRNQADRAARLFGIAEVLRESLGTGQPVSFDPAEYNAKLAATRAQLNEEAITTAWSQGRAMGTERAISFALERVDSRDETSA